MSAQFEFRTGTTRFHADPNFDYQLNRFAAFADLPIEALLGAVSRISSLSDWKAEFLRLAEQAHESGHILHAAGYYRLADFFLPYDDPQRKAIHEKCISLFSRAFHSFRDGGRILEDRMEYGGAFLPVLRAPARAPVHNGTILFTGGFDCIKEELVPVLAFFSDHGFDIIYFEGPGQGETLHAYGLPMTHEWEKPVKAILDRYTLKDVTLVGLSLGSCLALRAAVHDARISRVVCWGVMYDFFEVVTSRRGRFMQRLISVMLALRLHPLLNAIVRLKMKSDPYTHWGVDHGMHVFAVGTPSEYFRRLKRFTLKDMGHFVRQDVLLLAGAEDHFVPLEDFFRQARKLSGARSFTGRIFTRRENAQDHCQFGNINLALECIVDWILHATSAASRAARRVSP